LLGEAQDLRWVPAEAVSLAALVPVDGAAFGFGETERCAAGKQAR
jgi:hypothetical protein